MNISVFLSFKNNYFINEMFYVIAIRKEKPLTRHFDRNEAKLSVVEKSHTIACLQAIVFLKEILKNF